MISSSSLFLITVIVSAVGLFRHGMLDNPLNVLFASMSGAVAALIFYLLALIVPAIFGRGTWHAPLPISLPLTFTALMAAVHFTWTGAPAGLFSRHTVNPTIIWNDRANWGAVIMAGTALFVFFDVVSNRAPEPDVEPEPEPDNGYTDD
ncbi:MAG: hypothetical protein KDC26_10315 [Armatimonadetes bacterium]|nr:hypothetical protein [Armatimonadota bacterium]